jgi:hypothetical protein
MQRSELDRCGRRRQHAPLTRQRQERRLHPRFGRFRSVPLACSWRSLCAAAAEIAHVLRRLVTPTGVRGGRHTARLGRDCQRRIKSATFQSHPSSNCNQEFEGTGVAKVYGSRNKCVSHASEADIPVAVGAWIRASGSRVGRVR